MNDVWNRNPKAQPYVDRWCLNLIILAIWLVIESHRRQPGINLVLILYLLSLNSFLKKNNPRGEKNNPETFSSYIFN